MRIGINTGITSMEQYQLDFQEYVKHLRYYNNHIDYYHHKEVEKRFYEVLDKLGEFNEDDLFGFITLRLKSKSDWIIANNASNALEWKLCKYFWGRYGKVLLQRNTAPYSGAIEHNLCRIKDHIHAIIKIDKLRFDYNADALKKRIEEIALTIDEVNERDPDAVRVRIFPYSHNSNELGNTIEYMCKTSSQHHNPLERKIYSKKQQEEIRRKL
jgi:hypothetical protein